MFNFIKIVFSVSVATALCLPMTEAVASKKMSSLFDSVATSDPRTVSNSNGTVLSGGNVRLRAARATHQDIASFRPPSITGGCGGIDIFGGSFGIISKDQLVQTGRALVQSAAGYYFGLALSSICPLCNSEMKNLQEKLDQMNKFSRLSCQEAKKNISEFSEKNFGQSPEDFFAGVKDSTSSFVEARLGFLNSPSDSIDSDENDPNKIGGVTKSVAKLYHMGNSVFQLVLNTQIDNGNGAPMQGSTFSPGIFAETPLEAAELFMSLGGTTIAFEDDTQPNNYGSKEVSPAFTVADFIGEGNNQTGADSLRYHRCANPGISDVLMRCTVVDEQGGDELVSLSEQVKDIIHGETITDGIFQRILNKEGAEPLTTEQIELMEMVGINPYRSAALISALDLSEASVANFIERQTLVGIVSLITNELKITIAQLSDESSQSANELFRRRALGVMESILTDFEKESVALKKSRDTTREEVRVEAQMKWFKESQTNNKRAD